MSHQTGSMTNHKYFFKTFSTFVSFMTLVKHPVSYPNNSFWSQEHCSINLWFLIFPFFLYFFKVMFHIMQNGPAKSITARSNEVTTKYSKEEVMTIIRSVISDSSLDENTKKSVGRIISGILDRSLTIDVSYQVVLFFSFFIFNNKISHARKMNFVIGHFSDVTCLQDMCTHLRLGSDFAEPNVYRVEQFLEFPDRVLHKSAFLITYRFFKLIDFSVPFVSSTFCTSYEVQVLHT